MSEQESNEQSRRTFLQLGASALVAGTAGCTPQPGGQVVITDAQRASKRASKSKVGLAKTSYEELPQELEKLWKELGPEIKGKNVFLKMNLVDVRDKKPCCTDARFVDAVIQLMQANGAAKVTVGDGPALMRDTELLVNRSGVGKVLSKHQMQFVDLNIDDLQEIDNPMRFTGIEKFVLPKSIIKSDVVISLPKLKTHHWALMTASMKNLFGCLPGRKYGWPKNILHIKGINSSIVDLVSSIKPAFAIVDGIEAMEGDGPLNGTSRSLGALVMGDDLVAVDTVCGSCMELPIHNIPYLKIAGECWGNNKLTDIEIIGSSVEELKQKFELPPTYEQDGTPRNLSALNKGAESGVT